RKMSAEPNHATRRKPNAADWRPPLPDARRLLPSVQSLVGFHGAHFVAPHFDALANLVANFARTCEALFTRAGERGRIWKTPVHSRRYSGKDGAALGAGLVANGD